MRDRLLITPQSLSTLRADSETEAVSVFRSRFDQAKVNGNVPLVKRCPDSRLIDPELTAVIAAIAAGAPNSPYTGALRSPDFRVAVVENHFDGETIRSGGIPTGCGGRDGKRNGNGNGNGDKGISRYLDRHVQDDDLINQTLIAMSHVSLRADGKPTLGVAVNHRNLVRYPVGFVSGGRVELPLPVHLHNLMAPEYFPIDQVELYRNGIPTIDPVLIHPKLREFLATCRQTQSHYAQKYDLHRIQESQNPDMVILTSELRSPRYRFPSYFDAPGSYFQISLAITPQRLIDQAYLQEAVLDQINYPFSHFSARNLIIETRSIHTSASVARRIADLDFMEQWMKREDTGIALLETVHGITSYSDVYKASS